MQVADGLEWKHVFWMRGVPAKHSKEALHRWAVKDPPCLGWQHVLVITGEKRSTLFCPYSFESFSVDNHCGELETAREPHEMRRDFIVKLLNDNWKQYQGLGYQKDYDTAALVFKRLGEPVPESIMKGGEEDTRVKGGKETGRKLLKPVKRDGKRGKFLEWFLEGDGNSRSVREAMAEFSMTRSNALSYLYMLQKDHGIGYELVGDVATVTLPDGCTNPFNDEDYEAPEPTEIHGDDALDAIAEDGSEDEDDDSWLDG